MSKHRSVCVAVPVKDEAERIGDCLRALALQQGAKATDIVVLANDCTDGSARVVRALLPTLPTRVHVVEVDLPKHAAGAGFARRAALEHAARRADGGVLLTTDADGRVAPDWVAANLAAIARGADVVAGRAIIDPVDAASLPARLRDDDAREVAYATMLDEIHALIDPDPADPWPRHTEHSGASIAVTHDAYHRSGGVPPVAVGEDRGFIEALRRVDARVRHAPEVTVTVSGRAVGRAAGGMADTIARRLIEPDMWIDDALEPAADAARRARVRAVLRPLWQTRTPLLADIRWFSAVLMLPEARVRQMLDQPFFGVAWDRLQAESPLLLRRRVALVDLKQETREAQKILAVLRRDLCAPTAARPDDSAASVPAISA